MGLSSTLLEIQMHLLMFITKTCVCDIQLLVVFVQWSHLNNFDIFAQNIDSGRH